MPLLILPTKQYPSVECPLCTALTNKVQYEYRVNNISLPLYICSSCEGLFIRPMPIQLMNERKMDTINDAELISPLFKFLHKKFILSKEIRIIRSIVNKQQIELLDIGCGSGWSTDYFRSKGFTVEAVEASQLRCEFAREKYGLTVHNCYVEDLDITKKYDVVTLRHIVEHLEQPAKILNSVVKLLSDDGLLMVVVPNIDCIGKILFGRYWEWVLPWHCNFFNPNSLHNLIEKSGFDVIASYQSPSLLYYAESLERFF